MHRRAKGLIIAVLFASVAAVVWMFYGPAAGAGVVGNAGVLGGVAAVAALVPTLLTMWPGQASRLGGRELNPELRAATVEYLARETLRYWQQQAKDRRITTPSPAQVAWRWAGNDVAVPAEALRPRLLNSGTVTELRQQLYDRLRDPARIVILGGPGAGKTSAMLLLLIDVLRVRTPGDTEPVPVWLTLGGWDPGKASLLEWAASGIVDTYPDLGSTRADSLALAKRLIIEGQIALFLDGLDEVPALVRSRTLAALDRDAAGLRLVLTSRPDEFQDALNEQRLWTTAVIDILAVDPETATRFLMNEQIGEQRERWVAVTHALSVRPEAVAARVLSSPLTLALAREAYARDDPSELVDERRFPSPDDLTRHLLARSLELAYPEERERERALRWLSWVAANLGENRDLRWWEVPYWGGLDRRDGRPRSGRGAINVLFAGLAALFGALACGGWLSYQPVPILAGFACYGLFALMRASDVPRSAPRDARLFSRFFRSSRGELLRFLRRTTGRSLLYSLIIAVPAGLALWCFATRDPDVPVPWAYFPVFLLLPELYLFPVTFAVVLWIGTRQRIRSLRDSAAVTHAMRPRDLYRHDLAISVGLVLLFGFAPGIWFGMYDPRLGAVLGGLSFLLGWRWSAGPSLMLLLAQFRWLLTGRPVRFIALFDAALKEQVFRQAGPIYQFRHALLQDHLARQARTYF